MANYHEHFATRKDYLDFLAEEYELPNKFVYAVADMLGKSEDFDGLVSNLEDYSQGYLDY
jgi:hypothetical protein